MSQSFNEFILSLSKYPIYVWIEYQNLSQHLLNEVYNLNIINSNKILYFYNYYSGINTEIQNSISIIKNNISIIKNNNEMKDNYTNCYSPFLNKTDFTKPIFVLEENVLKPPGNMKLNNILFEGINIKYITENEINLFSENSNLKTFRCTYNNFIDDEFNENKLNTEIKIRCDLYTTLHQLACLLGKKDSPYSISIYFCKEGKIIKDMNQTLFDAFGNDEIIPYHVIYDY